MRMRPSADTRAPGIYQTVDPVVIPPLEVADTRIAGFLGLSLKGPMNEPTRIASWDEFVETFGYTDRHYFSDSVHGSFKNGGQAVWVVRIAHAHCRQEPRARPAPAMDSGLTLTTDILLVLVLVVVTMVMLTSLSVFPVG